MLNILKRRSRHHAGDDHNPLEIRDLLDYPQLRAVMGLDELLSSATRAGAADRPGPLPAPRGPAVTTLAPPTPLTRTAA